MRKYHYIYKITNLINGKNYIGQKEYQTDSDIENDCYFGSGKLIKLAIKKYGIENFTKTILIKGIEEKWKINCLEIYYIRLFRRMRKAEYNIADGGQTRKPNQ